MTEDQAPTVVLPEAPELLAALRSLRAAANRVGDDSYTTLGPGDAARLGRLSAVLDAAGDAVFLCLNIAESHLYCPAASAAIGAYLDRPSLIGGAPPDQHAEPHRNGIDA